MTYEIELESFLQLLFNNKSVDLLCQPLAHPNNVTVSMTLICSRNQIVSLWIKLLNHILDIEHVVGGPLEPMSKYVQNICVLLSFRCWLQLAYFMENYRLLRPFWKTIGTFNAHLLH